MRRACPEAPPKGAQRRACPEQRAGNLSAVLDFRTDRQVGARRAALDSTLSTLQIRQRSGFTRISAFQTSLPFNSSALDSRRPPHSPRRGLFLFLRPRSRTGSLGRNLQPILVHIEPLFPVQPF